jgi:hypothetical protein
MQPELLVPCNDWLKQLFGDCVANHCITQHDAIMLGQNIAYQTAGFIAWGSIRSVQSVKSKAAWALPGLVSVGGNVGVFASCLHNQAHWQS